MIQVSGSQTCPLCSRHANFFARIGGKSYYQCCNCRSIMLDPSAHPSRMEEKQRYDKHVNDIDDPGYQNFVRSLVEEVVKDCTAEAGWQALLHDGNIY